MVIIARTIIREFILKNPFSANAINKWFEEVKYSDWSNFKELQQIFNSCDYIGNDRYVFNIAGNRYRLIAMIHFARRTLYIRKVLTHEEYSKLSKEGKLNTL